MALSENARGAILMNVAMAAFTLNDTAMKAVMEALPMFQAMTLRGLLSTLALVFLAWRMGALARLPAAGDRRLLLWRAVAEILATITFFAALRQMPLANISAILQATPLAVTLAAALFLSERVGWRRSLAICVGFLGVMIIIRPGPGGFSLWAGVGVLSVICVVVRDLVTRQMTRQTASALVAATASAAVLATGLVGTAIEGWAPVTLREAGLLLFAAGMLIVGYLSIIGAMRHGDIGAVAPFRYMSLVWAILLGWVIFATLPDALTLLGAGIVVASGLYTLLREARLKRRGVQTSG